ncbi:hypothetical protein ACS0TY_018210 [Phlomoides rotata]
MGKFHKTWLGRLANLQALGIQNNHLSGLIPSAIYNISTLHILALKSNELSGSLPHDICHNLPFLQGILPVQESAERPNPIKYIRVSTTSNVVLVFQLFHWGDTCSNLEVNISPDVRTWW